MNGKSEVSVDCSETLVTRLRLLTDSLDRRSLACDAAAFAGVAEDESQIAAYESLLDTYLNEAEVGLKLIAPHLSDGCRILEVGSGIGTLAHFLTQEGYAVVGIEPGAAGGFGFMPAMSTALSNALNGQVKPVVLPIAAEDLSRSQHGEFDLIFSVNVFEHIMALDKAFCALSKVLAPNGIAVHSCANYSFPYEPHLAIPLVPLAPQLTRFVFTNKIRNQNRIWESLNFITADTVIQLAEKNSQNVKFEHGVMAKSFERLKNDPVFAKRHRGLVGRLGTSPAGKLIEQVLRHIPPRLATPMIFSISHSKSPN